MAPGRKSRFSLDTDSSNPGVTSKNPLAAKLGSTSRVGKASSKTPSSPALVVNGKAVPQNLVANPLFLALEADARKALANRKVDRLSLSELRRSGNEKDRGKQYGDKGDRTRFSDARSARDANSRESGRNGRNSTNENSRRYTHERARHRSAETESRRETAPVAAPAVVAPAPPPVERSFSIKHAALPPIVVFRNLDVGTTAEDVRVILEYIGPVNDVRAMVVRGTGDLGDHVVAEIEFENKAHCQVAIDQFHGQMADGRRLEVEIVRQHSIPEHMDTARAFDSSRLPVQEWSGPPLYSDRVAETRVPTAPRAMAGGNSHRGYDRYRYRR